MHHQQNVKSLLYSRPTTEHASTHCNMAPFRCHVARTHTTPHSADRTPSCDLRWTTSTIMSEFRMSTWNSKTPAPYITCPSAFSDKVAGTVLTFVPPERTHSRGPVKQFATPLRPFVYSRKTLQRGVSRRSPSQPRLQGQALSSHGE